MIQNMIFFLADIPAIHEYDGMTTSGSFAPKLCKNLKEDIGSIFYVVMIFQVTETSMYFILPISK